MTKTLYLLLLFLVLTTSHTWAQTTRYVNQTAAGSGTGTDWGNASGDLQATIDASATGDRVFVATGTYRPTGQRPATVEYRAVPGITDWTTNPNQFVDKDSRTANDVKSFVLEVRQSGVITTLVWDLKLACGRARIGADESDHRLSVSVLGNPVAGETTQLEIRGAEGQPLRVSVSNAQGRLVSEDRIGQAAVVERITVKLSRPAGVYLLRVSSPAEITVVRVLKFE